MPILAGENRTVLQSLEQANLLPTGLLQGIAEKRNGWRPQLNILPDAMLPESERGENKTEQEVITQNLVASKDLKDKIDFFGGNVPLATHAFFNGVEATQNAVNNGFSQNDINDLMDVARRQKNIVGEELTPDEIQAFETSIGKPEPAVYSKPLPTPPKPVQPVSLKRTEDGRYYTGDPLYDAIMKIESGGNPNAVSPTGATGLFQFTTGTGKQYGLFNGGDKRKDPQANFLAMKRLTEDNSNYLRRHGVPVNPTTIYLAHQQGAGGMTQLWNEMQGKGRVSQKVRNNMGLNWGDRSAREYYNIAERKVSEAMGGADVSNGYNYKSQGGSNDITGTSAEGDSAGATTTEATIPAYQQLQATEQGEQPYQQNQSTGGAIQTTGAQNIPAVAIRQANKVAPTTQVNAVNGFQKPTQADSMIGSPIKSPTAGTANPIQVKKTDWSKIAQAVFKPENAPIYSDNKVSSAIKGAVKDIIS